MHPKTTSIVMLATVAVTVVWTHDLAHRRAVGVLLVGLFFARKVAQIFEIDSALSADGTTRTYTVTRPDLLRLRRSLRRRPSISAKALERVVIDVSHAHFWDLTSVAALDTVVLKFRREGTEVEILGMNEASATLVDSSATHDKPGALDRLADALRRPPCPPSSPAPTARSTPPASTTTPPGRPCACPARACRCCTSSSAAPMRCRDLSGSSASTPPRNCLKELAKSMPHAAASHFAARAPCSMTRSSKLRAAACPAVTTTQRHGVAGGDARRVRGRRRAAGHRQARRAGGFRHRPPRASLERVVRASRVPVLVAARAFRPIRRFPDRLRRRPGALKAVEFAAQQPLLAGLECQVATVGGGADTLERPAAMLRGAGLEVTTHALKGDAEHAIAAHVAAADIDLLVMGAYGHSRIRNLLIGSTTTALLRACRIPVMVFR